MEEIKQALKLCAEQLFGQPVTVHLERTDEQFGDVATNLALQLSASQKRPPRDIALQLVEVFEHPYILEATVAGPGFINLRLTEAALVERLSARLPQPLRDQVYLLEYSDPNPLKPLHAGHLYTTLVGDSIARLVEVMGARVTRLNYGGDVGLHVGKNLWAILQQLGGEQPTKLADIAESERSSWLGQCYVDGNQAYETDEATRSEIVTLNQRVYQLHRDGDRTSALAQIYWTVRGWSYDYFALLYKQLQITPFDRFIPESEVAQLGLDIVRHEQKNGIYTQSQGAVVFAAEKYGLHTRVFINSAGLPTYETKDVGLLHQKWQDYHFDHSLVVTANEQAQYYEVMLKSVEQFAPEMVRKSQHLTHGVVKLSGGVKMSSRKGNVVSALEIIEAARQAAMATGRGPVSEETVLAAIKYSFSKIKIGGDIIYDPAESVALEGSSGPYLQYAHARARSILAKLEAVGETSLLAGLQPAERRLVAKIGDYQAVVARAATELAPHHICSYLYELAQTFNRFYEDNRVVGDERQALRAVIVTVYADRLRSGLELLGIQAPDSIYSHSKPKSTS